MALRFQWFLLLLLYNAESLLYIHGLGVDHIIVLSLTIISLKRLRMETFNFFWQLVA